MHTEQVSDTIIHALMQQLGIPDLLAVESDSIFESRHTDRSRLKGMPPIIRDECMYSADIIRKGTEGIEYSVRIHDKSEISSSTVLPGREILLQLYGEGIPVLTRGAVVLKLEPDAITPTLHVGNLARGRIIDPEAIMPDSEIYGQIVGIIRRADDLLLVAVGENLTDPVIPPDDPHLFAGI